jgi:hypothetical protein
MIVLVVAQLVSLLAKYPRCAAAIAPMTSQTSTNTAPMLLVLLLVLPVLMSGYYPVGNPGHATRVPGKGHSRDDLLQVALHLRPA